MIFADDRVVIPPPDYTWFNLTGNHPLTNIAGAVIAIALVLCGIGFLIGLAGWALARAGFAPAGRDQSFFASRAALAVLAAALLGALAAMTGWGTNLVTGWGW